MREYELGLSLCKLSTTVTRPAFVPSHDLVFYQGKQSTAISVDSRFESFLHVFFKRFHRLHVRLSLLNYPGIGVFSSEMKGKFQGRPDP